MGALTALDILVLLLVGGGMVLGFMRGFVTEVISLGAWIAAILALKALHGPVAEVLEGVVGTPSGAAVLSFALIFIVVFVSGKLLARRLGGATKRSVIGPFDRILGLGFGALKGLIGATLLFLAANLVFDLGFGGAAERPRWMAESRTYPLLNASGRAIVSFVEERRGRRPQAREAEPKNKR